MTPPHQDGVLDAAFVRDGRGRTVLKTLRQRFPLRTTVPFYVDDGDPAMAFLYVQNPTGAVFAHDRLKTCVAAGRGTRVHVTTQSATKLHRMEDGHGVQDMRFTVGESAYLEHIPDAIIPQGGSRFVQRTEVDLGGGGTFIGCDTLAPGRTAHGESFAYDRVSLRTDVRIDGRLVCTDRLELRPGCRPSARARLLGDRGHLVTVVAVAPGRDAARLAFELGAAVEAQPAVSGGAGELPDAAGVIVRVLAPTAPAAERTLRGVWGAARRLLIGLPLPPLRK